MLDALKRKHQEMLWAMNVKATALLVVMVVVSTIAAASQSVGSEARGTAAIVSIIASRAALNDYLRLTAQSGSPIDCLSPSAQKRFLDSLVFQKKGLGGFRTDDLEAELTPSQIYAILSLFGAEQYTSAMVDAHVVTSEDRAII